MKYAIIHDCDPGNDDAVAILMALSAPEKIEVLGITTVAGNAPLERLHENARKICELAGRSDIKVFAGCPRPLIRPLVTAGFMHGNTGLDGCTLPAPSIPLQKQHAVDFIIETCRTSPQKVTLVATGALTNIAVALIKDPQIQENIASVIWMGGSTDAGNITPAAEFNAYVDPHAAHIVFNSGLKIIQFGLNITHQILITPQRLRQIQTLKTPVAQEVVGILEHSIKSDQECYGLAGRAVHDACTIAYLLDPTLFEMRESVVQIETSHEIFMGATAISSYTKHKDDFNAWVAYNVDADRVFDLIFQCIASYDPSTALETPLKCRAL